MERVFWYGLCACEEQIEYRQEDGWNSVKEETGDDHFELIKSKFHAKPVLLERYRNESVDISVPRTKNKNVTISEERNEKKTKKKKPLFFIPISDIKTCR